MGAWSIPPYGKFETSSQGTCENDNSLSSPQALRNAIPIAKFQAWGSEMVLEFAMEAVKNHPCVALVLRARQKSVAPNWLCRDLKYCADYFAGS